MFLNCDKQKRFGRFFIVEILIFGSFNFKILIKLKFILKINLCYLCLLLRLFSIEMEGFYTTQKLL